MKHPAILQLRGKYSDIFEEILSIGKNYECWVDRKKEGIDIYFSDVNEARKVISKIKKIKKAKLKMSTKYAGLRKGRVRVLFVYCLRYD